MSSIALSESFLIRSTMPCILLLAQTTNDWMTQSYLGHDGFSVVALDIAERHLGALVLVELELRVVQVGDLLQRS
jgi:hypothetical protein